MIKLEKYTGKKTYMFPNGEIATKEAVISHYPAVEMFTFVVGTDTSGQVMHSLDNLSSLRDVHGIDPSLSDDEAIAAIEEKLNAPVEETTEVSAEERIAAALEAQVMMSMPDVEDEETESEVSE